MFTHPQVLLYVIVFDLFVGFLLSRYFWLARDAKQKRRLPLSWIVIICLVNLSGAFCGVSVEEAIAGLGGLAMAVLILPAIAAQTKSNEKA